MEEKIKVYIFPILFIVLLFAAIYTLIQPISNVFSGQQKNKELTEQQTSLSETLESIKRDKAQKNNVDIDLINIDIVEAWNKLGEITGETSSEDRINTIFSKFCLGK